MKIMERLKGFFVSTPTYQGSLSMVMVIYKGIMIGTFSSIIFSLIRGLAIHEKGDPEAKFHGGNVADNLFMFAYSIVIYLCHAYIKSKRVREGVAIGAKYVFIMAALELTLLKKPDYRMVIFM
jgi:hypothetical protein